MKYEIDATLYQAYIDARDARDAAQEEMDRLRDALAEQCPFHDQTRKYTLTLGGTEIGTWARHTSTRVDTKRLKADYPDIAAMYSTTTDYARLAFKRD